MARFVPISFILVLLYTVTSVTGQPLRKTDWTVIQGGASTSSYSYPRVASFSSGNYAIIYSYSAPDNQSIIGVDLYNSSSTKTFSVQTQYPINLTMNDIYVGPVTAPNVYVFPNNEAFAVWRMEGPIKYLGFVFNETAYLPETQYRFSGSCNATDYLDVVGSTSSHYVLGHSGYSDIPNILYRNSVGTQLNSRFPNEDVSIHSAMSKFPEEYPTIYTFYLSSTGGYCIQVTNGTEGLILGEGYIKGALKVMPFVLDDLKVVGALFTQTGGLILLSVLDNASLVELFQVELVRNVDVQFSPNILHMGNNTILVAISTSSKRINYQVVKISRSAAVLIGPEVTHDAPNTSLSVSMASTNGSDVIVVAKDVTGDLILRRTITFCGNGAVNLKEECDSSIGCTSDCKCQPGTVAINGTCLDRCYNGIATGAEECDFGSYCDGCKCLAGYRPTSPRTRDCQPVPSQFVPGVNPSLDCLEIVPSGGILMYFSYLNADGYDQTILYGDLNTFSPAYFGGDRPTRFVAGRSLTYPLSPYSTVVRNDTQTITWILSSFNLTVDLTNPKLKCPTDPSVDFVMTTLGNLTDTLLQKFLENVAAKYNVSAARLSAEYQLMSTDQQGINSYVIVVTVSASNSEESSKQVIKNLLDDIQKAKQDLVSELTHGLEEINPDIKTIAPSVLETRGQSTPYAVFQPVKSPADETIRPNGQSLPQSGADLTTPLLALMYFTLLKIILLIPKEFQGKKLTRQ